MKTCENCKELQKALDIALKEINRLRCKYILKDIPKI